MIRKNINNINEFHCAGSAALADEAQAKAVRDFNRRIADGSVRLEEMPCLCGNRTFDLIASVDRHSIEQKTVVCTRCGLVQSNPRMTEGGYRDFYTSDTYRRCYEGDKYLEAADKRYDGNYGAHIYKEVERVKKIGPGTSVIEMGAGGGWNLVPFMKAGAKVSGLEYSAALADLGRKHGIDMISGDAASLSGNYDVIIASHMIEHIPDPVKLLKSAGTHLNPDGIIYIEVPNIMHFGLAQFQNAHVYYFTPATLEALCVNAGFDIVSKGSIGKEHIFAVLKRSEGKCSCKAVPNDYAKVRLKLIEVKVKNIFKSIIKRSTGHAGDAGGTSVRVSSVIYLVESPFCRRDHERFGIETMKNNGFRTEVWDLTPVLYPEVYKRVKVKDPVGPGEVKVFFAWDDIMKAIRALGHDTFVISIVFYNSGSSRIFKAISENNVRYGIFAANIIPQVKSGGPVSEIIKTASRITPKKLANRLFLSIPFYLRGVKPADMILTGGEESARPYKHFPLSGATRRVYIHTLDYDIFLKERTNVSVTEPDLGVFLDEDVCFHPEYINRGEAPYSTADEYFVLLRKLFDDLSVNHGKRVIVAAHPRSKYEDRGDFFGGRQVIRWQTAGLVKRSAFVIAHSSTSVNFAVLFNKPIIFITTDDLRKSPQGKLIETMAARFGKKPINLNDYSGIDLSAELKIDAAAYSAYKNAYIKKDSSEDKLFWQAAAERIREI